MTKREQKERAKIKKELQQQGILPPNKPRLNRKKFIEDAEREWDGRGCGFLDEYYLYHAIDLMLGEKDAKGNVSLEAVGVAKTLKLALRLQEFDVKLKKTGRESYTIGEIYEYIKDILEM